MLSVTESTLAHGCRTDIKTGETERGHYDAEQEPARDQHPEHGHGAGGANVQELPV
jgi:hypothetical protein